MDQWTIGYWMKIQVKVDTSKQLNNVLKLGVDADCSKTYQH